VELKRLKGRAMRDSENVSPPVAPPTARLVLLGASNLARSIEMVLRVVEAKLGGPLEVFVALGHGRSYCAASTVLIRELPGISESELWDAFAESRKTWPAVPTYALVTDIGNDLLYGRLPREIVDHVERCVERLAAAEAKTVLTLLPVGNFNALSDRRFLFFRTVTFPACRLTKQILHERALEVNAGLTALAERGGIALVEQRSEWYGIDPIHFPLRRLRFVWPKILTSWSVSEPKSEKFFSTLARWFYLATRAPADRRWLRVRRRRRQPSARWRSGTTISFF
jgi:hypothetical protein